MAGTERADQVMDMFPEDREPAPTIVIDGYEIDYQEDKISLKFKRWLPHNRTIERDFVEAAKHALRNGLKLSGYAIVQNLRAKNHYSIMNDYGPIFARLAVAKHPELIGFFDFKPTGWGKARRS